MGSPFVERRTASGAALFNDGAGAAALTVAATLTETSDGVVSAVVSIGTVITVQALLVDASDGVVSAVVLVAPATSGEEITVAATLTSTSDGVVLASVVVGSSEEPVPTLEAGVRSMRAGRLTPTRLPQLDTAEVDNLTADMSPVLGTADPIVDVVVTSEARVGTDAATRPLLYGEWQVQGPLVRQRIKGALGVPGVTYLVRVESTSLSGRVAVAVGLVKVLRLA